MDMNRYGVAAIVGCLYVAGSIWLVHSQGESYRESLQQKRPPATAAERPSPPPSEEVAHATPAVTTREPAPTRTEPVTKLSVPSPPLQPARPANEGLPPTPAKTVVAETRPAPILPAAPAATTAKAAVPKTERRKLDPFWEQPELTRSWDVAHLKADDEFRLGQELHDLILHFNRPLETGPWQRRVEEVAEPFLKTVSRKDIRYTFTILDSNAVNAFSTPGGFIYVSRGLFNLVGEDEEYALEFVVAHEIAHVDLGHAMKCLQDPGVMNLKVPEGTLQKLYMIIIPFAYMDPQEYEADRWAYGRMKQRGRTDRECLAFLRKLEGHSKTNGFENGRAKPQVGPDVSPIANHVRAHTAAWKRLKELTAIIGKS